VELLKISGKETKSQKELFKKAAKERQRERENIPAD
jgi:hypothetical protein